MYGNGNSRVHLFTEGTYLQCLTLRTVLFNRCNSCWISRKERLGGAHHSRERWWRHLFRSYLSDDRFGADVDVATIRRSSRATNQFPEGLRRKLAPARLVRKVGPGPGFGRPRSWGRHPVSPDGRRCRRRPRCSRWSRWNSKRLASNRPIFLTRSLLITESWVLLVGAA